MSKFGGKWKHRNKPACTKGVGVFRVLELDTVRKKMTTTLRIRGVTVLGLLFCSALSHSGPVTIISNSARETDLTRRITQSNLLATVKPGNGPAEVGNPAWCVCVYVRACMRACVCVCVGVRACVRACMCALVIPMLVSACECVRE